MYTQRILIMKRQLLVYKYTLEGGGGGGGDGIFCIYDCIHFMYELINRKWIEIDTIIFKWIKYIQKKGKKMEPKSIWEGKKRKGK